MCLKFNQFMKSKIPGQHCFGNLDVGREYVCPNVGPSQPIEEQVLSPWLAARNGLATCHGVSPQLGKTVQCGGAMPAKVKGLLNFDPTQMQYTATGDLIEYNCGSCRHRTQQKGGGGDPSERQYRNQTATAPGYFLDVSAPTIGNRPIMRAHENTIYHLPKRHQNLDRKFNCSQPFWSPKCL